MGLEVTIINSGLTSTAKALVNRTRRYVFNLDLSYEQRTDEESRRSFYSGHASVSASWSFFFAKVFTDYHRDMKTGWKFGVWTVAATVPAVTSYLRVEAGRHFPTDVITGYAMGAFTGWLIPHLHSRSKQNSNINLYPTNVFGYSGLGLQLKLN
jgi:membrane-associated phospholipid phosphatase